MGRNHDAKIVLQTSAGYRERMPSARFPRFALLCALPLMLLGAAPAPPSDVMRSVMNSFELHGGVVLESAGEMPRERLHFAPVAGAAITVEQTQQMSMTMTVNGQGAPVPASTTLTTTRSSVSGPDRSGNMRVRSEILGVQQSGGVAGTATAVDAMRGLATEMLVSPEGKIVGIEVTNAADPAMAQMVEQIAKGAVQNLPQFPAEPVGIGARWRLEYDISVAGMSMLAETTNTLRSHDGNTVVIDVETSIQRGNSAFNFPGMPPDVSVEIGKLVGNATGTMTLDLATLASSGEQKMTMDMQMSMTMSQAGMPPMSMQMHMDQVIASRRVE